MLISFLFPPNLCPDNFFKRKTSLNLLQYFFCLMFWFFGLEAPGISAPQSQMEPAPPALGVKSYHWAPRDVPVFILFHPVILNHWPSFDFSLQNLLTRSLKTLWSLSYLEHVLLCVNSKHVFQASTDTLCDREDLVSFLSGTQL